MRYARIPPPLIDDSSIAPLTDAVPPFSFGITPAPLRDSAGICLTQIVGHPTKQDECSKHQVVQAPREVQVPTFSFSRHIPVGQGLDREITTSWW